jgi:hypothetical protein
MFEQAEIAIDPGGLIATHDVAEYMWTDWYGSLSTILQAKTSALQAAVVPSERDIPDLGMPISLDGKLEKT